jgi:hypothetical protein
MPAKKTHEEFKAEFEAKFDGVLELRDSTYKSARENIRVYCPKHGAFEKIASALLKDNRSRHPCPKCVKEILVEEVIFAWPDYFKEIKKVVECSHLDFSRVEYKGSQKKIEIVCEKHGSFEAIPAIMLNKKSGCPKCAQSNRTKLGADTILTRLKEVHGNKYKFEMPRDAITTTKINFICHEHGKQKAIISNLLKGSGCRDCSVKRRTVKKTLTTEQWIKKARIVHGDRYDYSKAFYKNARTKLLVTCRDHGDFEIDPSNHIHLKRGCKICSGGKFVNADNSKKRLTQAQFLEKANEVAPANLDFTKSVYKDTRTSLIVTCKIHGDFKIRPHNLFRGANCRKCATALSSSNQRVSKKELTNRIRNKFGNLYEVDENSLTKATSSIRLKCRTHGWFEGILNNLINSSGCPSCSYIKTAAIRNKQLKLSKNEIINRFVDLHGDAYSYSETDPDGIGSTVKIHCAKHGYFEQVVSVHLQGKGCPECGREKRRVSQFLQQSEIYTRLKELHGNLFIYPPNVGLDLREAAPIICREHGIFYQPLRIHLNGSGCSECSQSLGARRVSHWLTEHEIYYELEAPIPAGKKGLPLRADFFLPEHNMYIEYDGEQHFKPIAFFGMDEKTSISVFNEQKERDLAKENWILGKGFELLRIRFDQNVEHQLEKYFQV